MVHALTAKTLAQLLQVSQVTIYKLAKAHKLPSFRVGTAVRFDPRAVAQWLTTDVAVGYETLVQTGNEQS